MTHRTLGKDSRSLQTTHLRPDKFTTSDTWLTGYLSIKGNKVSIESLQLIDVHNHGVIYVLVIFKE